MSMHVRQTYISLQLHVLDTMNLFLGLPKKRENLFELPVYQ